MPLTPDPQPRDPQPRDPQPRDPRPRGERGVFLLLGASGSGKGSVGAAILQRGVITAHASMGAWLREALLDPANLGPQLTALQPEPFA